MNTDTVQGEKKKLHGYIQQAWGDLTNQPEQEVRGRIKEMMGTLQQKFGVARDEAARSINSVLDELGVDARA